VDHAVVLKTWRNGERVILAVHIDDCLATGSNQVLVNEAKERVNGKYKMTDLGPCKWLLGIKIERDLENHTTSLSQHAYIESILVYFNFDDVKPLSMPIDPNIPLTKAQSPSTLAEIAKMRNVPYREAVGSLMYASMGTRLDVTFATSTVAQFLWVWVWLPVTSSHHITITERSNHTFTLTTSPLPTTAWPCHDDVT